MLVDMLKTAEGNISKDIEKKDYKQVDLRIGSDISEEVYYRITAAAHLNERQHHTLFGDGKVLPVAFKRWENDRMEFLGIPTDIEGFMKIGKMAVKTSIPTNPSVTYYSVKLLTTDESTKTEVLKAVEKVSGIRAPRLAEEMVLGNISMRLVGGEWVGELRESFKTTKMRIGVVGRGRFIELDAEITIKGKKKEEKDETVAVRYTFSKAMRLVRIEAMAPSGNYVKIMNREMKDELVKEVGGGDSNKVFTVEKKFGEGENRIVVDYRVTTKGGLMGIDMNGKDYNSFALRPTKVQKGMNKFMANNNAREWYLDAVAGRWVTRTLEETYTLHTKARDVEGNVVILKEPIPFAGHDIVSFKFMGNDLVARAGPYSISVNRNNIAVSWVKEDLDADKETNILMQLRDDYAVLCEGGKHLSVVTDIVMRNGTPYLKALNSRELEILKRDKVVFEDGLLSIEDAKKVASNPAILEGHALGLTEVKLKQILEHEEDINRVKAIYENTRGLQHNLIVEKILDEHLREKTLPPIQK